MRLRATSAALSLISCAAQAPLATFPTAPESFGSTTAVRAPGGANGAVAPVSGSPINGSANGNGTRSVAGSAVKEPPSAASSLAPAISLGDIGQAGPVQLLAASASGAWVALCDGEPKTAKLVLGSGVGETVDEILAYDPTGRYVVVSRSGVTELVDAVTTARVNLTELGADARRLRADYAQHRTLSFDASGATFAYLRHQAASAQIVVRKLETGSEQAFASGVGDVLRLQLSPDARFVTFEALRDDTNKNGKLDWPAPEEPPRNACSSPALPKFRNFSYQGRGDTLTRAVVALADGAVRDVPDLVTPLGASLLVREADGSLRLDQNGKRTALSPAGCAARVLFADADRGLVLAACTPPPPKNPRKGAASAPTGKRDVWLFGPGFSKNLQAELYETSTDREATTGVRLVALYPGSDAAVVDLERREVLPLPSGSRVVTTSGALALVWRENDLFRYDAQTKTEQPLAHGVYKNPDLLQAGASLLLSPFVVVGIGPPALASPTQALAISNSGFVLTGNAPGAGTSGGAAGAFHGAIRGPLHWVDARLAPPSDGPSR